MYKQKKKIKLPIFMYNISNNYDKTILHVW